MIYSKQNVGRFCFFACDVDEKMLVPCRDSVYWSKSFVKPWLDRQSTRFYLRLFVFIDSVIENGFVDPVVVWANKQKDEFWVHPGLNRVFLKDALPEKRLVAWVLDNTVAGRHEYKDTFSNVKPIVRDKNGNRLINWIAQHRTAPNASDQYDFALRADKYLGDTEFNDTEERRQRWFNLKDYGFGIRCEKEYYEIGNAGNHWYEVENVVGVYQLALDRFFAIKTANPLFRRIQ